MAPIRTLFFLFCLLLPVLPACGTGCSAGRGEAPEEYRKPRILFLNVAIFRDTLSGREEIRLRDASLVDGKLKSDYPAAGGANPELSPGLLLCLFLDTEGNILKRAVVERSCLSFLSW